MTKPKTFEEQYPTIHRFVEENGWIEIGQNDMIASFVRAYDEARINLGLNSEDKNLQYVDLQF